MTPEHTPAQTPEPEQAQTLATMPSRKPAMTQRQLLCKHQCLNQLQKDKPCFLADGIVF